MYNNADEIAHTVSHCMGVFFVLNRFCSKISWMVIKKHTNIGIVVNIDKIITNAKLIKLSIKTKVFIAKYAKLNKFCNFAILFLLFCNSLLLKIVYFCTAIDEVLKSIITKPSG